MSSKRKKFKLTYSFINEQFQIETGVLEFNSQKSLNDYVKFLYNRKKLFCSSQIPSFYGKRKRKRELSLKCAEHPLRLSIEPVNV